MVKPLNKESEKNMNVDLKKIFTSFLAFQVGLVSLLILGYPFIVWGTWTPITASGFELIDTFGGGFIGILLSVFQILIIVNVVALLAAGVFGVIELVKNKKFKILHVTLKVGPLRVISSIDFLFLTLAVFNFFGFFWNLIFIVVRMKNMSAGLGIGQILISILTIASYFVHKIYALKVLNESILDSNKKPTISKEKEVKEEVVSKKEAKQNKKTTKSEPVEEKQEVEEVAVEEKE